MLLAGRFLATTLRALLGRSPREGARREPPLILTCYRKADCSLCDKAKEPVARAVRGWDRPVTAEWVEIAGDPVLLARWGERIPVVCVGETVLAEGKVSELRLRRALAAFLQGAAGNGADDA